MTSEAYLRYDVHTSNHKRPYNTQCRSISIGTKLFCSRAESEEEEETPYPTPGARPRPSTRTICQSCSPVEPGWNAAFDKRPSFPLPPPSRNR